MKVFLETLREEISVPQACELLGVGESYFHELRHRWLQEALELLEPRPLGRPPKPADTTGLVEENARLAAEVAVLREQLRAAEVRQEISQILAGGETLPGKKKDSTRGVPLKPR
jgi:hypothetical protein